MNTRLVTLTLAASVVLSACGITATADSAPLSQRVSDMRAEEAPYRAWCSVTVEEAAIADIDRVLDVFVANAPEEIAADAEMLGDLASRALIQGEPEALGLLLVPAGEVQRAIEHLDEVSLARCGSVSSWNRDEVAVEVSDPVVVDALWDSLESFDGVSDTSHDPASSGAISEGAGPGISDTVWATLEGLGLNSWVLNTTQDPIQVGIVDTSQAQSICSAVTDALRASEVSIGVAVVPANTNLDVIGSALVTAERDSSTCK